MRYLRAITVTALLAAGSAAGQGQKSPQDLARDILGQLNGLVAAQRTETGSTGGGAIYAAEAPINLRCDGTDETDKFAAISAAIGTGGKRVILPQGSCALTSWSLSGKNDVVIEGQGGFDLDGDSVLGTELLCTATGSGACFDFSRMKAPVFRDIAFAYDQTSFTGTLVDMSDETSSDFSTWNKGLLSSVSFYRKGLSDWTNQVSAARLLYVYQNVDLTIFHARFAHGQVALQGCLPGVNCHATASLKCYSCDFVGNGIAIRNPGPMWTLIAPNFEPGIPDDAGQAPAGILVDAGNGDLLDFTLLGATFSDSSAAGTWIEINTNVFGFTMAGGSTAGDIDATANGIADVRGIAFNGSFNSGISITGHLFSSTRLGIDFGTGACVGANVTGNTFPDGGDTRTVPVAHWERCDAGSNFDGNSPPVGRAASLPSASACGASPSVSGTDRAGSVSVGAGAKACSVDFGTPWGTTAPICAVTPQAGTVGFVTSATAITLKPVSPGQTVSWICQGN